MKILITESQFKAINESVVDRTISEMKNVLIPAYKKYLAENKLEKNTESLVDFLSLSGNDRNWFIHKMTEFMDIKDKKF